MPNRERLPIIISIMALLVSAVAMLHGILIDEYGVLIGRSSPEFQTLERIRLYNSSHGLQLHPQIIIHNNGTRLLKVKKVEAFIKLDVEERRFRNISPFTVRPGGVLVRKVVLSEKLKDDQSRYLNQLEMDMANELLDRYHEIKKNDVPIELSNHLYGKVKAALTGNVSWLHADDGYSLLLMFWLDGDVVDSSKNFLYTASISEDHLRLLLRVS